MTLDAILARLAAADIELLPLPGLAAHVAFHRGGFAALVEYRNGALGHVGAAGLLCETGLALLLNGHFQARGYSQAANAEQIALLRRFQADLERAIASSEG